MPDRKVRATVWRRPRVAREGDADTAMLDALGMVSAAGRINILAINGRIEGREITSARATPGRRPAQSNLCTKVLDRISLVVAEKHREAAEQIMPDRWGLAVAPSRGGVVEVTRARLPEMNAGLDAATPATLLWRDEALAVLERCGATRGVRSKPREALSERLAAALDLDRLRAEVHTARKVRSGRRGDR